jgi:hypothetical protein
MPRISSKSRSKTIDKKEDLKEDSSEKKDESKKDESKKDESKKDESKKDESSNNNTNKVEELLYDKDKEDVKEEDRRKDDRKDRDDKDRKDRDDKDRKDRDDKDRKDRNRRDRNTKDKSEDRRERDDKDDRDRRDRSSKSREDDKERRDKERDDKERRDKERDDKERRDKERDDKERRDRRKSREDYKDRNRDDKDEKRDDKERRDKERDDEERREKERDGKELELCKDVKELKLNDTTSKDSDKVVENKKEDSPKSSINIPNSKITEISMIRSPRSIVSDPTRSPKSERSTRKVVINESQNTVKIFHHAKDDKDEKHEKDEKQSNNHELQETIQDVIKESNTNVYKSEIDIIDITESRPHTINSKNNPEEIKNMTSPRSIPTPEEIKNMTSPRIIKQDTLQEKHSTRLGNVINVNNIKNSNRLNSNRLSANINVVSNISNNTIPSPPLNNPKNKDELRPIIEDEKLPEDIIERPPPQITSISTVKSITTDSEFDVMFKYVKSINYDFLEFILEKTSTPNIFKVFGARMLSNNGVILYVLFEKEYMLNISSFSTYYDNSKTSIYEIFKINHDEMKYFNDKIIATEYYQKTDNDISKEFRSKNDKLYQISINDSGFITTTCKLLDYKSNEKLYYKIETVCIYESQLIDSNINKLGITIAFENYYINETNQTNFKNSLKKINSHMENLIQMYKLFADTFRNYLDSESISYYTNIIKHHPDIAYLIKYNSKILEHNSSRNVNDKLKQYHTTLANSSIYDLNEKDQESYTKIIKQSRIQTAYLRYFDELLANCDEDIKVLINYCIIIIKFCDSKTINKDVVLNSNKDLMNQIKLTYNSIHEDLLNIRNIFSY